MRKRILLVAAALGICGHRAPAAAQQSPPDTAHGHVYVQHPTAPPVAYVGLGWSRPMSSQTPSAPYIVTKVVDQSPAFRAGLAAGDRILMVNGMVPGEMDPLFPGIAPGRRYRLTVQRGDQQLELEIVADPPKPVAAH